ncbi:hypothetical protein J2Z44_000205 [Clostridium punense]|uniref:Transcriptional regulator n=1 Tax=Clostridium punense TaxID=1054297 RepID=A0ABS4JY14_9CLOT|nr:MULTISPECIES: hypothetical protein [Clostridium]EQB87168.1 hypothetical protein M918_10555 [Clostridium sp. BL8]MBP2020424.1 hypothetical protein [Clostridium punense]
MLELKDKILKQIMGITGIFIEGMYDKSYQLPMRIKLMSKI